jgi:peroxiredoxin family protein/rhodanese-related sulfurtransferase/TusA-related sulfurtransferase
MLGFTAANILRGDVKVFHFDEVDALDRKRITLLDVRTPAEVDMGTIEGALNITVDQLRERMNELPKDKPVYVFCQVGQRGYIAARILTQNGFDAYNLSGGYKTYMMAKDEPENSSPTDCIGIKKKTEDRPMRCETAKIIEVDACGLQCPGPIMRVSEGIKGIKNGETLMVKATDPAFASDINVWCERTGNELLAVERDGAVYKVRIRKGTAQSPSSPAQGGNDKSMVIFSGELDKALAALIIANGAASMGRKVTLFFTFWGLNILRRDERVKTKKNVVEKMFGMMMPRGSKRLGISKMNMGGMGARMIRGVMKSKNVSSLEELIRAAMDSGVRIVACQMSMDIMGIKKEELIDGVEIGGVATFLGSAELSDTNLFI